LGSIDIEGLKITEAEMKKLFEVDKESGLHELEELKEYFKLFGDRLPKELTEELNLLEERFSKS
jgi:phosphoenolpyruvate carboxykinase (GTP)